MVVSRGPAHPRGLALARSGLAKALGDDLIGCLAHQQALVMGVVGGADFFP